MVRRVSLEGEAQEYMVNGLEPNTQYSFRICGKIYPGGYNICSVRRSALTLSGEQFAVPFPSACVLYILNEIILTWASSFSEK